MKNLHQYQPDTIFLVRLAIKPSFSSQFNHKMFIKTAITNLNKKIKNYIDPDHNPSEADVKAFQLLQSLQMEEFIQHFEKNGVNVNVQIQISGLNLLMKAVEKANSNFINGMNKQQIVSRVIILINFLIEKGIDINMQDKSGRTALLAACHWDQEEIVDVLIKHKADLNLCTTQRGWISNPLLSATFKQKYRIMDKLIVAGADIDYVFSLSNMPQGFKIEQEQRRYLQSARNLRLIIYSAAVEEQSGKTEKKMLTMLRPADYQELLELC